MVMITFDEVVTKGDVLVTPGKPGETTFVTANKRGRDAVQRAVERHVGLAKLSIAWRDAGEGWPDTWLGFDFVTPTDKPFAALIREEGVAVFHRDEDGTFTYLPPPEEAQ
jgi:hypothetical protein